MRYILAKAFFISFLFCCANVYADVVTLKSGKVIEGKILEKTDKYIKIDLKGNPVYYELHFISDIKEDQSQAGAVKDISSSSGQTDLTEETNLYLRRGLEYGAEDKFKEAEEEFQRGLAVNSSDNNLKEALRIITDFKNNKIKKEYALYLLKGSHYLMNSQFKAALSEFKNACEIDANNPDIYYYLGICSYSLDQYPEAITYLQKAIELYPQADSELYYYLGASNFSLGKYSEAIACLEKTIAVNPEDAQAYSIIGTSNYLLGNFQQAKENLLKATTLLRKRGDVPQAKEIEDFLSKID